MDEEHVHGKKRRRRAGGGAYGVDPSASRHPAGSIFLRSLLPEWQPLQLGRARWRGLGGRMGWFLRWQKRPHEQVKAVGKTDERKEREEPVVVISRGRCSIHNEDE